MQSPPECPPLPTLLGKSSEKKFRCGRVGVKIQHDVALSYCLRQLLVVPAEHYLKYNEGCFKISEANTAGKFSNFYPPN